MASAEHSSTWMAGCCGFGPNRGHYLRHLPLVELQDTFFMPPPLKTLGRWRREAPEDFTFVLKAWQLITHPPESPGYNRVTGPFAQRVAEAGLFRDTEVVREAYALLLESARALRAPAILFETPQRFTPTVQNRQAMTRFFEQADRQGLVFAWDPRGVWSASEVGRICRDLRLVPCADGLEPLLPSDADCAYVKVAARRTEDQLLALAESLAPFHRAFCIFNTVDMYREAIRFQALIGTLRSE